MKLLKVSLVLAGAVAWTSAGSLPALDFDHEHGRTEHHGGEIGQASQPTSGHAPGKAGLDRAHHRHPVFPECDHAGHPEALHGCCKKSEPAREGCSKSSHALPNHRAAAAAGDCEADHRDCCDEVHVHVPTGYSGPSAGYWSAAEVQMDYAFHHLTGADLARDREALEKDGVIPQGAARWSSKLDRVLENLKAAGIDPRAPAAAQPKAEEKSEAKD